MLGHRGGIWPALMPYNPHTNHTLKSRQLTQTSNALSLERHTPAYWYTGWLRTLDHPLSSPTRNSAQGATAAWYLVPLLRETSTWHCIHQQQRGLLRGTTAGGEAHHEACACASSASTACALSVAMGTYSSACGAGARHDDEHVRACAHVGPHEPHERWAVG